MLRWFVHDALVISYEWSFLGELKELLQEQGMSEMG